jgi:hypothetical protein
MGVKRWEPKEELSGREEFLMKRLVRTRKLFGFLRAHRRALFDSEFQAELETMYRDTGAGKDPLPPAIAYESSSPVPRAAHDCVIAWRSNTASLT